MPGSDAVGLNNVRRSRRTGRGSGDGAIALGLCLAASVLATLINPYGVAVYAYAADLSRLGLERGVEEWMPPGLDLWVSRVFFSSVVLLAGVMLASRRRLTVRDVCLLGLFLPPALIAVRMTPWWLLVVTPIMARLAAGVAPARSRLSRRSNGGTPGAERGARVVRNDPAAPRGSWSAAGALAVLFVVSIVSLPWLEKLNPLMGAVRPIDRAEADVQAVSRALLARSTATPHRIFARFEWGNYLCWAIGARNGVFMEGHVELYPDDLWRQYLAVSAGGARWEKTLDLNAVDALLLDAAYHGELLRRVRESARWDEVARSGDAVAFVRRPVREVAGAQDALQANVPAGR